MRRLDLGWLPSDGPLRSFTIIIEDTSELRLPNGEPISDELFHSLTIEPVAAEDFVYNLSRAIDVKLLDVAAGLEEEGQQTPEKEMTDE